MALSDLFFLKFQFVVCILGAVLGGISMVVPSTTVFGKLRDGVLILACMAGVFLIGGSLAADGASQLAFGQPWLHWSMQSMQPGGNGSVYSVPNVTLLWAAVPLAAGVCVGLLYRIRSRK